MITSLFRIWRIGLPVLALISAIWFTEAVYADQTSDNHTEVISATHVLTGTNISLLSVNEIAASSVLTDRVPVISGAGKLLGYVSKADAKTLSTCAGATTDLHPATGRVGEYLPMNAIDFWQAFAANCRFQAYAVVDPSTIGQIVDFAVWFDRGLCPAPLPADSWYCEVIIHDTTAHGGVLVYVKGTQEGSFHFTFDSPSAGIAGEDHNVLITISGTGPIWNAQAFLPLVQQSRTTILSSEVITNTN